MSAPDDDTLSEVGLAPAAAGGKILLIACGALAREILALKAANNWTHIDLSCLPAKLHSTPDKITDAVKVAIAKHRADYEQIYVVYADCGTGGQLQALCDDLRVEMIAGPHCYAFYEGNTAFLTRAEDDFRAFYLTDFLVRQFEAFVWKPLGLDRYPDLLDMYFGNYEKLIYQAQTDDPELDQKAQHCAARLGLSYERQLTGYGDLGATLAQWATNPPPARPTT